jgi:hypothetical protein
VLADQRRESESVDQRASAGLVLARAALEGGDTVEVQRLVDQMLAWPTLPAEFLEEAIELSVQAMISDGDEALMAERGTYLDRLRPARLTALLRGTQARLAAERAHLQGDRDQAEQRAAEAEAILREAGVRPRLAQALLERARRGDGPDPLAEARAIYAELGATRWLERAEQEFVVRA